MESVDIHATFKPEAGDRATLSKASRATLDALFRHPVTHNLEWPDVVALFAKLGTADHKSHNEIAFGIGTERHLVHKPHAKDLTASEVMAFRHILTRAGWSPATSGAAGAVAATPERLNRLVVVDHHEAHVYDLDLKSADAADHAIRPYDPHHVLHHLSHKDKSRERGQRAPEEPGFYQRIADTLVSASRIVLIGHGKGHSNAAHHLDEHLRKHCPETFQKVVCEVVADLSSLTRPQLLAMARRALTPAYVPRSLIAEGESNDQA